VCTHMHARASQENILLFKLTIIVAGQKFPQNRGSASELWKLLSLYWHIVSDWRFYVRINFTF